MLFKSLVLVAGATLAVADSTVTLFLPGFDAQSIDAKILGSVRLLRSTSPGHSLESIANLHLEQLHDHLPAQLPAQGGPQ